MKKILLLLVLIGIIASGNAFAQRGWAIGGEFTMAFADSAYPLGAALCVKFPQLPIMFGFSASFDEPLVIGITADWWLFQSHLVGPVNIYIGPGAYLTMWNAGGESGFGIGMRIPFGFQIFIVKAFEIFLEPALSIGFFPDLPTFGFQAALGFRFWF